jgi:hypothetical protein
MPTFPTQEELARIVHVTADTTIRWDGKEIDLAKGKELPYGVLLHYQTTEPSIEFTVKEVTPKEIAAREIVNPLDEGADRGEAFAGLKKRGRPAQG